MGNKEEIKVYLENGISVVEGLLMEDKYLEAAQACKEILDVVPNNKKVLKLLKKSQKHLEKDKEELFKNNFPKFKSLYRSGEYEKALQIGEELKALSPSAKLSKLIRKCRKSLEAKQKNELKDFIKNAFKKQKQLAKEKKWLEAIEVMEELLGVDRRNERARALIKADKIHYIDHELKSEVKKSLTKGEEYDKLYKFYQKLYILFPDHKRLKKEIKKTEKLILAKRRIDKSEFIKTSLENTKKLLADKQFEKAIQASKEMLQFTDGESLKAKNLLKKATEANREDTDKKLSKKLPELVAKLKEEFKAKPKEFVKI